MTALALDAVSKRYGDRTVVDRVTMAVAAGERLALLGHNGAGKTTLMKMILGLTLPSGGAVRTLGEDPVRAAATVRHQIGFLPENVAFHDAMTGREVLRFYASLKRRPRDEVESLLERVGLAFAADRRVSTYSKGMRQRLGLAQALLGDPKLMLLDEPTNGLDPELRASFYDILRERAANGTAILLSSHILTELEERTDRLAILDHGRLVAFGSLDDLRQVAGLPVRFRVRLENMGPERLLARLNGHAANVAFQGGWLSFSAPVAAKAEVVRLVAGEPAMRDFEIAPPTLESLYAHYTGGPPL